MLDALSALALKVATVDRRMHAAENRVACIGRARISIVAVDRRVHTSENGVACVDRADITIIAVQIFKGAPNERIAYVGSTGIEIVTGDRLMDAAQHWIARIDRAEIAIVAVDRRVYAFAGLLITGAGCAGVVVVAGRFALPIDTLLAGGTGIATGTAVVVIEVEIDALIRAECPAWIASMIKITEDPADDQRPFVAPVAARRRPLGKRDAAGRRTDQATGHPRDKTFNHCSARSAPRQAACQLIETLLIHSLPLLYVQYRPRIDRNERAVNDF